MRKLICFVVLTACLIALSFITYCVNKRDDVIVAKLTFVLDGLHELKKGNPYPYYGRAMFLRYVLINKTNKRLYIPIIKGNNGFKSRIVVKLNNNKEMYSYEIAELSINYKIKDSRFGAQKFSSGNLIEPNDTGYMYFRIRRIEIEKDRPCVIPTKKLLSMIKMSYQLDSADIRPGSPSVPKVVFENDTNDIEVSYCKYMIVPYKKAK